MNKYKVLFVGFIGITITLLEFKSLREQKLSVIICRIIVLNIPILLLANLILLGDL